VHYRTPKQLQACLAALERQRDPCREIVVVDNSDSLEALEAPSANDPWRLHRAARNLGFGAACNLGARMTDSDYLLFLNADLVLSDEASRRMRLLADKHPGTAVIGPRIQGADGQVELSARSFPSLRTGVLGRSSLATRALRRLGSPPGDVSAALATRSSTVDWVSGACMLIRRRAFEDVGGFDDSYWMYWEDADICHRLRDRGWDTMLCVDAHARHSTGSSGESERTIEAFHASAARYYERHVAPNPAAAKVARGVLRARMKVMLRRHAGQTPVETGAAPPGSGDGRRVLIDALAARFGGTAYAAVELARHLAIRPEVASVLVLTRRGSIVARELAGDPAVRCVQLPPSARLDLLRRTAWEALRLRRFVVREGCDVAISMSGIFPRPPGCRVMCLLGNSLMYESRTLGNRLRRLAVRNTAREAAYLVAPSRPMADLVSRSTGRPCAVAPLGVEHRTFYPAQTAGEEILCVADFYAHKRHDLVLDAWLALSSPRPRLRLVGDPDVDPDAHARLLARIETLPEADSIVFEYRVAHQQMADIYRRARVFVLASEHESFCMPLAECMACGIPAVVRGLASLRDTGGEGATYVEGDNAAAWASAAQQLMDDDAVHQDAREAAITAAARFTWEALAEDIARQL
jgi:N-acetylglucosaminyl-diphospho-decaprenol L-rhamnosyltransferase